MQVPVDNTALLHPCHKAHLHQCRRCLAGRGCCAQHCSLPESWAHQVQLTQGLGEAGGRQEGRAAQLGEGRWWSADPAARLDANPHPWPIKTGQICASDFACADPSSPIGLARAYPWVRGKYPVSSQPVLEAVQESWLWWGCLTPTFQQETLSSGSLEITSVIHPLPFCLLILILLPRLAVQRRCQSTYGNSQMTAWHDTA